MSPKKKSMAEKLKEKYGVHSMLGSNQTREAESLSPQKKENKKVQVHPDEEQQAHDSVEVSEQEQSFLGWKKEFRCFSRLCLINV